MDRWLRAVARLLGTVLGAFVGLVALQIIRLRRTAFLDHPGFEVDHLVEPDRPAGGSSSPALRMVVFGDSTVAGVGVERAEHALPVRIAQDVARARQRPVHVIGYGWPGARAADLGQEQIPRALAAESGGLAEADLVVLVIGSNDATHRTPPHRYRSSVRQALELVRAAAPDAEVALVGIPTFRGTLRHVEPLIWLTDQYARLLRPISRQEAERLGVAFADLAARLPASLTRQPGALSPDRFHPSAQGYRAWAEVIAEALSAQRESPNAQTSSRSSGWRLDQAGVPDASITEV